ncbi:MAG: flagellar export chaperone FliS [Bryobacteraceae bacterium]
MNDQNFYTIYAQSSLLEASPLQLVIALYEGAIGAIEQAKGALVSGEDFARSRSITKAVSILAELMCSLDHDKGGEISGNLKRLYSYMQQRLLLAHATKSAEPMNEVVGLLSSLLESWRQLSNSNPAPSQAETAVCKAPAAFSYEQEAGFSYGSYFPESAENIGREVYSF